MYICLTWKSRRFVLCSLAVLELPVEPNSHAVDGMMFYAWSCTEKVDNILYQIKHISLIARQLLSIFSGGFEKEMTGKSDHCVKVVGDTDQAVP